MDIPLIPSPPTDNLYKFMALAGIVLLVAAPFFWTTYRLKQEEHLRAELRWMAEAQPPSEYYLAKVQIEHGETVSLERRQMVERFDYAEKELGRVSDEFAALESYKLTVSILAATMGTIGLSLAAFGFPLWYVRVQRPLDRLLVRESKGLK